ncbi:MAG: phosphonoacetaldehyde hydrolase [Coriobacteriia bacterium]|nr:phosphonoacetaldehyde hydrolase [Coriobacteriia bacterium]
MTRIKAVILDWAGTTVDFGCMAPVDAFLAAFGAFGIEPTMDETRAPMGMAKRAHIKTMLDGERLAGLWRERYGRAHTGNDIDAIYAAFEPALFATLSGHAGLLPSVLETVERLRARGILIGSTTGYTRAMMDVVTPLAAAQGYTPDCLVCPDEVAGVGRPYPHMLWRNLEQLGIESIDAALKVGDTLADIQEGNNAGCLSVGVIYGSSLLGLGEDDLAALGEAERSQLYEQVSNSYFGAGADYVIEDISQLPQLIRALEGE